VADEEMPIEFQMVKREMDRQAELGYTHLHDFDNHTPQELMDRAARYLVEGKKLEGAAVAMAALRLGLGYIPREAYARFGLEDSDED
jgi:hypothetical protein